MTSVTSLSSASISSAITTDQKRLQKPITQLQTQATGEQAEISAWGTIQGSVSSLSGALANIADIGTLNTRTASSTQSSVATATAAASAAPNTYSLTNIKLAKPQEIYSALQTSPTQSLGSGAGSLQFTLTSGKTETVQIPAGSNTLNGIAAAINAAAGDVQASVIGTSSGARLLLQSAAPGSANGFTFTGGGGLAALHYASASGGSFTRAQPAQSASFEINGVPVTSASNSISSAVSGVTLNLLASGAATITIASSAAGISSNLASVASTLSAATAAIAKATKYVPASSASSASSAKSGPLLGNYTATALANSLLTAVSGAAASGLSANAIGFSVSTSGSVSFNAGSFATAYAANPTAVTALVNKLYAGLNSLTTAALGSATSSNSTAKNSGEIGAQTAALQNQITALTAQENQIAKDNSAALEILVQQYTRAESASTNAQVTQAYLSIFTGNSSSGG